MKISNLAMISLIFTTAPAWAGLSTINANNVNIDYDIETFFFQVDRPSFGSIYQEILPGTIAAVSAVNNGINLDFSGSFGLAATGGNFYQESLNAVFSVPLAFTANSGYQITGYTITYTGIYGLQNVGDVSLSDATTYFSDSVNAGPGGYNLPFTATGFVSGAALDAVAGQFNATADYTFIDVFVGYVDVFSHYESVPYNCDGDGNNCQYMEVEVYRQEAVYEQQGMIGDANISLNSIQIVANVVAVPEADTYAMLLAGLGLLGWVARRRLS